MQILNKVSSEIDVGEKNYIFINTMRDLEMQIGRYTWLDIINTLPDLLQKY